MRSWTDTCSRSARAVRTQRLIAAHRRHGAFVEIAGVFVRLVRVLFHGAPRIMGDGWCGLSRERGQAAVRSIGVVICDRGRLACGVTGYPSIAPGGLKRPRPSESAVRLALVLIWARRCRLSRFGCVIPFPIRAAHGSIPTIKPSRWIPDLHPVASLNRVWAVALLHESRGACEMAKRHPIVA